VVPTWNYVSVHLTGRLRIHLEPERLLDLVTRLTERYERHRARPWTPDEAPDGFVGGQLRAIVGVELEVVTVEAKRKLSQNRDAADRAGVIAGLAGEPSPAAARVHRPMSGD
jgi:transcriptional regulator